MNAPDRGPEEDDIPRREDVPPPEEEDVVDAEIVDEPTAGQATAPEPPALLRQDLILAPCHHGCTCGLHTQVVYGSRVAMHPPGILDHGEMGLLTEAAERAARRTDEYHAYLARRRALVERTHGKASKALAEFDASMRQRGAGRASRDELDRERAALTPAQREPVPRWLKVAAFGAAAGVAVFDAYFFQQTFLNILQINVAAPWWERDIGLLAALVFAVGVIAAGRILCGPVWRLGQSWGRQASPDEKPPSRLALTVRALVMAMPPAAILFVLGWWASLRGQLAVDAAAHGGSEVPGAVPVMLLLLSLALTVIMLEVLVYNPYQAAVTRDKREVRRLLRADHRATDALTAHDIAWRDLRASLDEVMAFIRAELARPWHTTILPARLRHGRAGPEPVPPGDGVNVRVKPGPTTGNGISLMDSVDITYQIFEGVPQPQPSPGPLAETMRSILEFHPGDLRARHRELQDRLFEMLGQEPETEAGA